MTIFALMRFFVPKGHTAFAEAELDHTGVPANAAYHYLGHDHLGTGRFAYNQAKAQTGMVEHDAYGRRITQSGYVPYHEYTGKPYEQAINAYYFPYRYYNPSASRWLAPDPAGLIDGPNVYGYVRGNPVMYHDPLGTESYRISCPCTITCACELTICTCVERDDDGCGNCRTVGIYVVVWYTRDFVILGSYPCDEFPGGRLSDRSPKPPRGGDA